MRGAQNYKHAKGNDCNWIMTLLNLDASSGGKPVYPDNYNLNALNEDFYPKELLRFNSCRFIIFQNDAQTLVGQQDIIDIIYDARAHQGDDVAIEGRMGCEIKDSDPAGRGQVIWGIQGSDEEKDDMLHSIVNIG
ncbi:uncharacterized protein BCR38DRAFT_486022 [Pseudomassariella vexata]|uniref:Ecp2 effector protein-like domain-containing protein n=1 Tax=Pseudomassariella vexata TaxID=1141098 RepID=A0A1Y2DVJ7_9PEZI|nr:uncharacterized protein BCR38DRAFT_486022 [Pseudomassariella vexata]ORY63273.1 hypothetical protein BCR38DRAFT_486022 [Pseudomassariella vexata]